MCIDSKGGLPLSKTDLAVLLCNVKSVTIREQQPLGSKLNVSNPFLVNFHKNENYSECKFFFFSFLVSINTVTEGLQHRGFIKRIPAKHCLPTKKILRSKMVKNWVYYQEVDLCSKYPFEISTLPAKMRWQRDTSQRLSHVLQVTSQQMECIPEPAGSNMNDLSCHHYCCFASQLNFYLYCAVV